MIYLKGDILKLIKMCIRDRYQGYQFANAPANTINTAHPVTGTGMLDDFASNSTNTIWDSVVATADDIPGTNVPATFQINLADDLAYINPKTGSNTLWTNANATEHMGEYIARLDNGLSVGVRAKQYYQAMVQR